MRSMWNPALQVIEGDRVYEWKDMRYQEVRQVGRLVGEPALTESDILFNAFTVPDMRAAVLLVLKKAAGEPVPATLDGFDFSLSATEVRTVDDSGREVSMKSELKPCGQHREVGAGIVDGCPNCGLVSGPVMSADGDSIAWFYVDGEPVPTRRGPSTTVPATSPTSYTASSGSPGGTTTPSAE